jgi:hypothetical protein
MSSAFIIIIIIIIISLLISPLLGHRPSLWITHKENEPTHHARPVVKNIFAAFPVVKR